MDEPGAKDRPGSSEFPHSDYEDLVVGTLRSPAGRSVGKVIVSRAGEAYDAPGKGHIGNLVLNGKFAKSRTGIVRSNPSVN